MRENLFGVVLSVVTLVKEKMLLLSMLSLSILTVEALPVNFVESFVQIVILSKPIFLEITVANILWYRMILIKMKIKMLLNLTSWGKHIFSWNRIKDD